MGSYPLEHRLEELLSESIDSAVARQRTAFDELAAPFENRLVLFGAGRLGRLTASQLRKVGIEPLAFTDNDPAVWGRVFDGVPALSPQDAASKFRDDAAFVVTIWNGEASETMADRMAQLKHLGCRRVVPFGFLFWKFPDLLLPHYCVDRPSKVLQSRDAVLAAFSSLSDEESRHEYVRQIAFRLRLDFDVLARPSAGIRYFSSGLFRMSDDEVFVDCGAFDGDTLRSFVSCRAGHFKSIIAFEPDPANRARLDELVKALPCEISRKIRILNNAVGARPESVRFHANGTAASAVNHDGTVVVDCIALDKVLEACAPTMIKFDIEGSELEALAGAARTIECCKPVLAVSAYHRQDHIWRIPRLIASSSSEYRFFLRPEGLDGFELVCYAVPVGRLSARSSMCRPE